MNLSSVYAVCPPVSRPAVYGWATRQPKELSPLQRAFSNGSSHVSTPLLRNSTADHLEHINNEGLGAKAEWVSTLKRAIIMFVD